MYQPEQYFLPLTPLSHLLFSLKAKELITIKPSRELNFLPINKRYVSTLSVYNKTDLPVIIRVLSFGEF